MSETSKVAKTVQEKLNDLTGMIAWFQSDKFSLEASLDKFKEAEMLADDIEKDLTTLKNDITIIKKKFDTD